MINYSFENFLFKQIKLSQSRFSSSCKLGNSAQFSIKTPIELNTLCFVLMIIHCTSRSCHVIYTNTSVCAQRMGELEFKKIPRKSSTAIHCLVIRYFKTSLKTILLVLGGSKVEKSNQGEENFGSSITNTIIKKIKKFKKNVRFEKIFIHSHLPLPSDFRDTSYLRYNSSHVLVLILPEFIKKIRTQLVNLLPPNSRNNEFRNSRLVWSLLFSLIAQDLTYLCI